MTRAESFTGPFASLMNYIRTLLNRIIAFIRGYEYIVAVDIAKGDFTLDKPISDYTTYVYLKRYRNGVIEVEGIDYVET